MMPIMGLAVAAGPGAGRAAGAGAGPGGVVARRGLFEVPGGSARVTVVVGAARKRQDGTAGFVDQRDGRRGLRGVGVGRGAMSEIRSGAGLRRGCQAGRPGGRLRHRRPRPPCDAVREGCRIPRHRGDPGKRDLALQLGADEVAAGGAALKKADGADLLMHTNSSHAAVADAMEGLRLQTSLAAEMLSLAVRGNHANRVTFAHPVSAQAGSGNVQRRVALCFGAQEKKAMTAPRTPR